MLRACGLVALLSLVQPLAAADGGASRACATSFDCSLNGACKSGACVCDSPWVGAACETMQYAVTPASSKNLWTGKGTDENLNTWNGPIIQGADGTYHLFDPVYQHASLWHVDYYAHGTASNIEGPYDWSSPNISSTAINPGGLVFPDKTTGKTVYSLWIGGDIWVADDAAGPYAKKYKNPMGGNTAPAYANGTIYVTSQSTTEVKMSKSLAGPWSTFSAIKHPKMDYTVEDPYMYIDPKGNFHVINHAYNTGQKTNCSASWVSSHFFSADGKVWGHTDQPYGHTVKFDDGTSHSYCTLERPSLNFDKTGKLTHIHFAADLVTENGGCASRKSACVNCKYADHAGTLLVKLGA